MMRARHNVVVQIARAEKTDEEEADEDEEGADEETAASDQELRLATQDPWAPPAPEDAVDALVGEALCQLCQEPILLADLRSHLAKVHGHSAPPNCAICHLEFGAREQLKEHVRTEHLAETFTCSICDKKCHDLDFHNKCFHMEVKSTRRCPECDKEISEDNFTRHMQEFHRKVKVSCPHCSKEFGRSNLSRHIKQVHLDECTECPDCGVSISPANLNKHIKTVHKRLKKTCDICSEEVPYASISVHMRRVHNIGTAKGPRGSNLKLRRASTTRTNRRRGDAAVEDDGSARIKVKEESELDSSEEEEDYIEERTIEIDEFTFTIE